MNKIAFLFSGQGSEFEGMGLDLYNNSLEAKELFDQYKDIFDFNIMFYSNLVHQTKNSQPSILFYSYILASMLKKEGIVADYCCGLSLGEYTALTYASCFDIKDSLELIKLRGIYMQEDLEKVKSSMYAILNPDMDVLEKTVLKYQERGIVSIANYNAYNQVVISGLDDVIEPLVLELKELGFKRLIKLNTTGAFHTKLLENASLRLNKALREVNYNDATCKVLFNVTGKIGDTSKESLVNNLTEQIKSSVLFIDMINTLKDEGVTTFIEIGPKKVLANFVKNIYPSANIYSVYDLESLNNCKNFLNEVL